MTTSSPDAYTSAFDEQGSVVSPDRARRTDGLAAFLRSPVAAAALGFLGGGLTVIGVTLPWVSTFAGLVTLSGIDSPNGRILLALGVLAAVASLVSLTKLQARARWVVGLLGFLTVLWSGYLLINLLAEVSGADGMTLPAVGPGLPVVLVGGLLALSVLFLPQASTSSPVHVSAKTDAPNTSRSTFLDRSTWPRVCAIVFATVAALAHIPVTPAHLQEAPYIGIGFLLLTAVLLLLSTGLLISSARWLCWALVAVCLAAVAAYVVSRTVGLPLMADDIGNWSEPLGTVSIVTETLAAVSALLVLWRSRSDGAGADRGAAVGHPATSRRGQDGRR